MSVGEHEMRHDLLVYDSDDGFAKYVGLFVEEGVEAGHPVLVVANPRRQAILDGHARRLGCRGRDARRQRPGVHAAGGCPRHLEATLRALLRSGAEAVRVYGELPVVDDPEQQLSWLRYEAIINHVFAAEPVWVTCGYDARGLSWDVVDNAWRTHREVHHHGWRENPQYEPAVDLVRSLAPAPVELPGLRVLPLVENEGTFRRLLARELAVDGVPAETAAEMVVAGVAVLSNAERHGGGLRGLRAGRAGTASSARSPTKARARRSVRGLRAAAQAARPDRPLAGAADDEAARPPVLGQRPHRAALGLSGQRSLREALHERERGVGRPRASRCRSSARDRGSSSAMNSVTPSLRFCFLNDALAIAHGTVWSFSPEMISSGPRLGFLLSTLTSVQGLKFAVAAWNSGAPGAGTANWS